MSDMDIAKRAADLLEARDLKGLQAMLVDDISIPAVGYSTDFETDSGGWEAAGFAHVSTIQPQTFRLTLVIKHSSGETNVKPVTLDNNNSADIFLDLQNGDQAMLAVSGTTRFTRELAAYSIRVK